MRTNTLNLQVVVNLGNYETLRLGAEWTPEDGKSWSDSMREADAELRTIASRIVEERKQAPVAPATPVVPVAPVAPVEEQKVNITELPAAEEDVPIVAEHEDTRELITKDSPKFAKILKRIEQGVVLDKVLQYYRFDETAQNVVEFCARLNTLNK